MRTKHVLVGTPVSGKSRPPQFKLRPATMRVCILGTGNYAKAIGSRISHAGLDLVYGSRRVAPEADDTCPPSSVPSLSINGDSSRANGPSAAVKVERVAQPGELIIKAPRDAVKGADIIIMAIPITGHAEMVSLIQDYLSPDAVIIDVSNTTFSRTAAKKHADSMEASIAAMATSYAPRTDKEAKKFAKIVRKHRKAAAQLDKLVSDSEQNAQYSSYTAYNSMDRQPSQYSLHTAQSGLPRLEVDTPLSPPVSGILRRSALNLPSVSIGHESDPNHKTNCTDPCCNPGDETLASGDERSPLISRSSMSITNPSSGLLLSHRTPQAASPGPIKYPTVDSAVGKHSNTTPPTSPTPPFGSVSDIENLHTHPKIARRHREARVTVPASPVSSGYMSAGEVKFGESAYAKGCPTHGSSASCDACTVGSDAHIVMPPSKAPWNSDCYAIMSNAEHLQRLIPRFVVVKAFNTISAYALLAGPGAVQEDRVLVCGDHQWAKDRVFTLVQTMGMRPVDAGPLMSARDVEKKSVVFFEDWRAAVKISIGLFLLAAIYIAVRDIALVKGFWPDLFLLKFNTIIAWHALALFTATFLAGAVAALRQLTTGTAKVAFPNWLDKWLRARKSLGLMALASAGIHMIAAVMTDHLFVDFSYVHSTKGGLYQGSIFAALLSLIVYSALGTTSIPSVGSNLSWREWTFVQSKLGIVGLAFGAIHSGLMVWALGDLPNVKSWPYYLPPAALVITCAALILILIRIILAIPIVSKRLDRIRGGT